MTQPSSRMVTVQGRTQRVRASRLAPLSFTFPNWITVQLMIAGAMAPVFCALEHEQERLQLIGMMDDGCPHAEGVDEVPVIGEIIRAMIRTLLGQSVHDA